MTRPIVECIDAVKKFGEVSAVNHVSFSLEPGEILSLLGPSGCGKTTMLRIVAGFEEIDDGEVHIGGQLVSSNSRHVTPEFRKVGMVFQDYALFPHLSVSENVSFGLQAHSGEDSIRRLTEVLDLVKLSGMGERYPYELSGGEQQRVALARTLAPRPVVVLLDEPFSNIDATMRAEMRSEVERILRGNNIATVFVTHDREEAFSMADRLGVMGDGCLDQIDTPDVIYHSPITKFVARMTGVSDFIRGTLCGSHVATCLGQLPWDSGRQSYVDGSDVSVLIRLDDFQIVPNPEGESSVVAREFLGDEVILVVKTPSGEMLRCRRHHYSMLPAGTRVTLFPTKSVPFSVFGRDS